MALDATIGGNGLLFVGEDKTLQLELLTPKYDSAGNKLDPDSTNVPIDMSGMALIFDVRLKDNSGTPPLLIKTPSIVGVYNAIRSVNTQRAQVVLTDTDMETLSAKTYRHSWKRLDADSETILAWGNFVVQIATASKD